MSRVSTISAASKAWTSGTKMGSSTSLVSPNAAPWIIVATDAATLVFCEVKTRVTGRGAASGERSPLESIGPDKRRRLRRMAAEWLTQPGNTPGAPEIRFDAVGVLLDPRGGLLRLEHIENAF